MRISDWSSDVCSSDLHRDDGPTSVGNRDLATGQNLNFPSDVLLRQALFSQGCKPGSLYDDAAFGTPNGLALPFVVGANALAGIGANVGYRDDGNLRPLKIGRAACRERVFKID